MAQPATLTAAPRVKPRLRGVSHQITFFAGLAVGLTLWLRTPPSQGAWAVGVYLLSFLTLFGVSALYHRPQWTPRWRKRLQRLDHAAIFVLIAGTYTPIAALAVPPDVGARLLTRVWGGAAAGVALSVLWPKSPKAVMAVLCVALGWVVIGEWAAVRAGLGLAGATGLIGGGVLYTLGAAAYALRWPDPLPRTFGYHEVFHAFVVAGALWHAWVVAGLVTG